METPSLGGLAINTQNLHLSMMHGYTPMDAKQVFQNQGLYYPQCLVKLKRVSINNNALKSDQQDFSFYTCKLQLLPMTLAFFLK